MTTTTALKLFMQQETNLNADQIQLVKDALAWYSDNINDLYYRDHIINIVDLYKYVLKLKAASK